MVFDTVDHNVLLTTLWSNFVINGTALEWFKNYLASRNMKIKIGNTYSDEKELTFSLIQGSCSRANLFNMYSSTISNEIDSSLNLNGFADDHSFMKKFNPNSPGEESDTIDLLVNNLANIKICMNSVRLKMNHSKSALIIFANNTQTHKYIISEINIEEQLVPRSYLLRYLRSWMDSKLTFKTHVKSSVQQPCWTCKESKT